MTAVDRAAVLVAMWRCGFADPARVEAVRLASDEELPRLLLGWGAPAPVLDAAGLPRPMRRPSGEAVRRRVAAHLAMLGMDELPLRWVSRDEASLLAADDRWEGALGDRAEGWALSAWGPKGARIAARRDEPAWRPLYELLTAGVLPAGPRGGEFLVARS